MKKFGSMLLCLGFGNMAKFIRIHFLNTVVMFSSNSLHQVHYLIEYIFNRIRIVIYYMLNEQNFPFG